MSCSIAVVGSRLSLDPASLWLWHRPAAVALIGPLAWEHPYALGAALKRKKKKKKDEEEEGSACLKLTCKTMKLSTHRCPALLPHSPYLQQNYRYLKRSTRAFMVETDQAEKSDCQDQSPGSSSLEGNYPELVIY